MTHSETINEGLILETIKNQLAGATSNDVEKFQCKAPYQECYFIMLSEGTVAVGIDYDTKFDKFYGKDLKIFTSEIIDFEDEDSNTIAVDLSECESRVSEIMQEFLNL